MAIAFVQSTGKQTGDNITTKTITLNGVVAGNHIIVTVSGYSGNDSNDKMTVTDGDGKYTCCAKSRKVSDNISTIWLLVAATAGTHSIVIDMKAAASYVSCAAVEFSSSSALSLDVNANDLGTSTTPGSTSPITTRHADELIVGVCAATNNQASITVEVTSPVWNTIYEELSSAHIPGEADYKIVSATGTYAANWTLASSSGWTAVVATFFESGGSSGGGEHSSVF